MSVFIQISETLIICADTGVMYQKGATCVDVRGVSQASRIEENSEQFWQSLVELVTISKRYMMPAVQLNWDQV